MAKASDRSNHQRPSKIPAFLRRWLLRLLVPLGGHKQWIGSFSFSDDDLARAIGLGHWVDDDNYDFDPSRIIKQLRRAHAQAEAKSCKAALPNVLTGNCARLASLVGLNEIEQKILAFAVLLHGDPLLDEASGLLGNISSMRIARVLSVLLDAPVGDIQKALMPKGLLAQTGLVTVDESGLFNLRSKLDLLDRGLSGRMLIHEDDPANLFNDAFSPAPPATLELSNFSHVRDMVDLLLPHLQHTLAQGDTGVNVLIYGRPGTGKTQLTRVVAQMLDAELFQVSSEDSEGDPIDGERRLRAYRAAQGVLSNRRALLIFDEAEVIFSDGGIFDVLSTAQKRKAWVNLALENNSVPCIWLSNSIQGVDPAFVRRFNIVFELPVPPRHQRSQLIEKACGNMLDRGAIERMASLPYLCPALITRAADVGRTVFNNIPSEKRAGAVERLVEQTLAAQGYPKQLLSRKASLPTFYNPAYLNAGTDLSALVDGIAKTGSARICLYGPPGTGKTAFGHWLSASLSRPLYTKRVSDLVTPYVGETEQNIAGAFREASADGAILLFDELDSFLIDRRIAQHHWQTTEANEMLSQMEYFSGVFLATTNAMGCIDQAALRRFDVKLEFDYLRPDQAWELFTQHIAALHLPAPDMHLSASLEHLTVLTPGDFLAVARQVRLRPVATAEDFLTALRGECEMKEGRKQKRIGFV